MDSRRLVSAVALMMTAACAPVPLLSGGAARPEIPPPGPVAVTTSDVQALAEILQSEDSRDPEAATVLVHLSSPTAVVRARAALALGALGAPGGGEPLVALLADPDTAVAAAAAFALGHARDTAAVPRLATLLGTGLRADRVTVSAEAAYALGKIRTDEARAALRTYLASAPIEAGWHAPVVESALLAIWRFPRDDQVEPIDRWAGSADPEVRWRAIYALVRRPEPSAVPLLRAVLRDPDARARAWAVRGLTAPLADSAGIDPAAVVPGVIATTRDEDYIVRINAIGALGTYRDEAAVAALIAILSGDDAHETFAAAEALARIGEAAAAAASSLSRLAENTDRPVALRAVALGALDRVAPADARRVAASAAGSREWRIRAAAAGVLAGSGTPESERLLRDPDGRVAAAALQATLTAAGDDLEGARPLIVEALRSEDIGVRTSALGALGELADPSTLPLILDAYAASQDDAWNDALLAALQALGALRSDRSDPGRAFFARFPQPPADPVVHRTAEALFGARARAAWGPALPIATGMRRDDYENIVRDLVVPDLQQRSSTKAVITTQSGVITLRLLPTDAPLTVRSFATLADAGYFDGQEWPRVVPNFVVQGGDPRGDTSGGPGYVLRDEIGRRRYGTGTLGMALSGPDTGGSQFFITHSPQPHLDGIYAIFGEVVSGQEVAERILPGERITSIRVEREPWTG